jgi:hypothetical protein
VASVTPPPTLGQTGPRLSHSRARLGFARSAVGSAVSEDRRIRLLPVKRRAEEAMEARLSGTEASFEATRRVERDAFVEKLDAQGRRHRLYLDTAEHLVYEPPDARSIVVAPYHSVAAFNFELDQNANVHIAWYQDRDRQLHYVWLVPMEDGSFAVHSEAVLGSPDEPTSISVTLSAMGVKVEYQTAAAVGYYRIDPQRPTERIAWESRND